MSDKLCSIEETAACAEEFAAELLANPPSKTATVVALKGDLGSGKTAFVKSLARALGVTEIVLSPTFVILKIYKLPPGKAFRHLVHIDAYRLENIDELRTIGWEELVSSPENLIVVEWPENVSGLMPEGARQINFSFVDEKTRRIKFNKNG